jgi:hypothetical protein
MKVALPFQGRRREAPTWRELLELRPIRNPALEWSEENERVVLCIKHGERRSWKLRLVNLLVPLPPDRRVALDAIGTDVWRMLDGRNTVGRIAKTLAKKYKLSPREAELSLQQFFKELGRRGYVGFLKENEG